jgi:O-succinylbenzoic acid--CoA ligase
VTPDDALSIEAAAREAPGHVFVIDELGREHTFRATAERVRSWPRHTSPRAIVGVPTLDTLVAMLDAFERRHPLVPLHPRWTEAERERARTQATTSSRLDASHLALLFTSGTSGTPKGALLSRRAFVAAATASAARLGWRDDDRWLLAMPLAHVGGLSVLVRCLVARRTIVLGAHGSFDPASFVDVVTRHRVTLASLVPTQLAQLVRAEAHGLSSLRAILLGGAACPASVLERAVALGHPIHTTYGLTEMCAQVATSRSPVRSVDEGVGEPLDGVDVKIEGGHILVRSASRMDGWLDATLPDPFDAEGFYDTGDLGELDAHGRLHVHTRRDDLIVTGGENVYPAEVERALLALEGVEAACVVGLPDETWGQCVAAAYVSREPLDEHALMETLRGVLAGFKVPRRLLRLDALPTLAVGKLDRARLRALLSASER